MLDIIKLAESNKEEDDILDLKAKVKSFAINYIFAIRKISPMLKWGRDSLSKSECMLMAGYINDVNKQAMEVLFNLVSLVEPVSGELVKDELAYAESVDRAISEGDFGEDDGGKSRRKSKETKKDTPTFTVPVDKDYEKLTEKSGKSNNIIKKMFSEFMDGLKSGMDGDDKKEDKPAEKKPRKPRRKKGDDGENPSNG